MKALVRNNYGFTEVLKTEIFDKPKPDENEILIKIHATTVNRTDCAILKGRPLVMRLITGLFKPKKQTLGTDLAGHIVAIGTDVKNFKLNDRVWGFNDEGLNSHCEYLCIDEDGNVVKIPNSISYSNIVACAEGAHYAINFINKVEISADKSVLINGATGAIGIALLQLLKYQNVYVTAVCNHKDRSLIKSLGADNIIDYEKENFLNDNRKYDYIFDAVGKSSFSKCKILLKKKGIYISSELGKKSENLWLSVFTKFIKGKKVIIPVPKDYKSTLEYMNTLIKKGKFKPIIDRIFPFSNILNAYDYVDKGIKVGNVIIEY